MTYFLLNSGYSTFLIGRTFLCIIFFEGIGTFSTSLTSYFGIGLTYETWFTYFLIVAVYLIYGIGFLLTFLDMIVWFW